MPGPAERTSSTVAPAFVFTVQVAHEQHSVSTATSLRSSSSTPGSGRKDMRRPSDVWVHSVMAPASPSQRPVCAARPADVRVQATGTVPPAWPEVVCDVVIIAIVGLTLQEIKVLLAASPDDAAAVERLREVAERKLPEIAALIARSLLVRDWLECATRCECPSLDDCPLFDDPALLPGRDDADTNGLQPGRRQT
jgi:MerR, DNA binding